MLGDTSKFRTVMAYITEQAEAGGFDNALKAIDKLSQAIDSAIREGFKETMSFQKMSWLIERSSCKATGSPRWLQFALKSLKCEWKLTRQCLSKMVVN